MKHFPRFLYFALACGDPLPNPSLLHEGDLETGQIVQSERSLLNHYNPKTQGVEKNVNAKCLGGQKK